MKKVFLILLLIGLGCLAYQPIMTAIAFARGGGVKGPGPVSCEYNGRTYGDGEQRQAPDACNVCTCGSQGWSCTTIACTALEGSGTISGTLSYPTNPVPGQRVCAVNLKDDKTYCQQTLSGQTSYVVTAPPGDYWVYASLTSDDSTKRAYYTQFQTCGQKPDCKDHSAIKVTLAAKQTAKADPTDWSAGGQIDSLVVSPSKWEFGQNNYYPGSSNLVLTGRTLAGVKIYKTSFPPPAHPDDPPLTTSLIGDAVMTGTETGTQTWSLPIPSGMKATTVYAVGTADDGDYMTSRELRLVVPYFDTWGDNNASSTNQAPH